MAREEVEQEILWFESLRDCIEDDEKEDALKAIDAALNLLRRKLNEGT